MTLEEVKEIKDFVRSMSLEPPWCENVEQLKKWTEGFEQCQYQVIQFIASKEKELTEHGK